VTHRKDGQGSYTEEYKSGNDRAGGAARQPADSMAARAAAAHTASETDKEPRQNKHGPSGGQLNRGYRSAEQGHGEGAEDDADEKRCPPGPFLAGTPEHPSQNAADTRHTTVQKNKQGRRPANQ
tara:strand:+ start:326 stop:697 length:372 start_codon:yes stop_codon:yes gene_type:complete